MFRATGGTIMRRSSPWVVTAQRSCGAQVNHDHDSELSGRCAAEVVGVKANVTTIPEPTGRRTYEMCRTFHLCVVIPLGLLLCSGSRGARGNYDHNFEPSRHRRVEVTGVEAVVTMIPESTRRCTYGVCGMFHLCAVIPPLLSPTLTDAQDLGPLVSAWVWPTRGAGTKRRAKWVAAGRGG
jgi:hypothetical protein